MNRYIVVWLQSAADQLMDIWLAFSNRQEITAAGHRIDSELAVDASLKGSELSEGLRVLEESPLVEIQLASRLALWRLPLFD
mgnify:CR=1 FL=1